LTGAIAPLADLSRWTRGNLLVIVLLVLGAVLLTRLAESGRGRIMARIDAR
jgi:moderate conductance mechanosensitive channel